LPLRGADTPFVMLLSLHLASRIPRKSPAWKRMKDGKIKGKGNIDGAISLPDFLAVCLPMHKI